MGPLRAPPPRAGGRPDSPPPAAAARGRASVALLALLAALVGALVAALAPRGAGAAATAQSAPAAPAPAASAPATSATGAANATVSPAPPAPRLSSLPGTRGDGAHSVPGLPVLAAGAASELPFAVAELDPVRQVVDAPRPFSVTGVGLDAVALAALYDAGSGTLAAVLPASVVTPTRLVLDVPAGLAAGDHWLTLWTESGGLGWASIVFLDPPLPVVEFAVPPIASATAPTALAIHGQHLAGASRALLERDGARLVGLDDLAVVGESELQVTVPADLDPGPWRVRVVTRGGISIEDVEVLVVPAPRPVPRVTAVAPRELANAAEGTAVLTGGHLAGALEVRARGPAELVLEHLERSDGSLEVRVPAGAPPGLYDLLVRTAAGRNEASEAKLLVVDPGTSWDVLGDGSVLAVDDATVRLLGHGAWSVVQRGRLRALVDLAADAARISDAGEAPADLGIDWEAQAPPAYAQSAGTTYLGLAANPAAGGVDFRFEQGGVELFQVTWGLAHGALETSFAFDASDPAFPGNALAIALGSFDLPRGHDQLVAAWGGVSLRAIDLLQPRNIAFPDHYDHPLLFAQASGGGGLLVDMGALGDHASLRTVHRRTGPGATRVELELRPELALRTGGSLGPMRFALESAGWAEAVEPLQESVDNPLRPAWIDEVTSVFRIVGLNRFSDRDLLPGRVEEVYAAVEPDVPAPAGWQLLHVVEPNEEGLAGVPDWTLSAQFGYFSDTLRAQGWRVLPYLATPGLQDEHPLFPLCSSARLATWDKAAQQLAYRFWDADGDGSCCADPMDYWLLNIAHAPYRDFLLDTVGAQRDAFAFDGIYLDFMKANARRDDRNPFGGDAVQGYRDLAQELVQDLGGAGEELLLAGEGSSVTLTAAGNGLAAIHLLEPGLLERDPLGGDVPLHRAHPIGTHLTLDHARAVTTSELAMPGWHPGQFHMVRLAEVMHGALPTGAAIGFGGWVQPSFGREERRALVQIAEEGLWWRLHGVRPVTDPHPLWSDPETARLFEVDGAVVARTRRWIVEKSICDVYWRFGARGPTGAELDELAARTDASFAGIFAAMCEIRARFRQQPTPPAEERGRAAARAEILAAMPDYPAP